MIKSVYGYRNSAKKNIMNVQYVLQVSDVRHDVACTDLVPPRVDVYTLQHQAKIAKVIELSEIRERAQHPHDIHK